MRILHVLHDFLPGHVAGVEVYTDELARRMALQHEVALFYTEAVAAAPDYSLRRGLHGKVATYELVNHQRGRSLRETYANPAVDQRAMEVLEEFRPSVVHVQHLLHLSLGVVREARRRGLPVVMTLHDHWLACARGGQRFHPSLGRCAVLEAKRCGSCTARLSGRDWLRPLLGEPAGPVLALAELEPDRIEAGPGHAYRDQYLFEDLPRPTWVAHPPARLVFRVHLDAPGTFTAAVAMHPDTFEGPGGGVRFRVRVDGESRFEVYLDPKRLPADRAPARVHVGIGPGDHELALATEAVPAERNDYCTAGWIDPVLSCVAAPPRSVRGLGEALGARVARAAGWLPARLQTRRVEERWEAMRALGAEVDLFLVPSRYLADEMVRFGLPSARVVYCDYGFPLERFPRRHDLPELARRFAFVGSLVRHKGVHVLLAAFEGMPGDARLDVCGPLHYDAAYSGALRRISRHPGVRFVGARDPRDIPGFLAGVDCLVVPSIWDENSPLTVHEAFLAGVPVVASRLGGHPELLAPGGGLLYEAEDPEALRAALLRLYHEPGLARRLAASAPAVKGMQEHVAELEALYAGLLEGRSPARVA